MSVMRPGLSEESADKIDNLLEQAVSRQIFPGAVLGIIQGGEVIFLRAQGYLSRKGSVPAKVDSVYDLASLTKVLVTTTAVLQLVEQAELNLHDYLCDFFPAASCHYDRITPWHLLTHTSGLPAVVKLWQKPGEREKVESYLVNLQLESRPGEKVLYSDPNFLLLGLLVEKLSGMKLDDYARKYIFAPLGLKRTGFNPLEEPLELRVDEIAPTEDCSWRGFTPRGQVHDENCYFLGGVSGQAGLFSCLPDLLKLMQALTAVGNSTGLKESEDDGSNLSACERFATRDLRSIRDIKLLSSRSLKLMASDCTPADQPSRGLGWDRAGRSDSSCGVYFSPESYGHTGFTGSSIWHDPEFNLTVILLTNRVNYGRDNLKHIKFRPRLHNLIAVELSKSK